MTMDRATILGLSVSALREKLRKLELSTQGPKAELQERLLEYYVLDFVDANRNLENSITIGATLRSDANGLTIQYNN